MKVLEKESREFIGALSGEHFKELSTLLANETTAKHILCQWLVMAAIYSGAPLNTFVQKPAMTNSQTLQRLRTVIDHIDGLVPLLDERLAWITACHLPGFSDGPEVAEGNEQQIQAIQSSLTTLRVLVKNAIACHPPIGRGRQLQLSPMMLLTIPLVAQLKDAGVPMGTGEGSKMVKAVRLCWAAAGIDEEPRDLLRSLEKRRGAQKSK